MVFCSADSDPQTEPESGGQTAPPAGQCCNNNNITRGEVGRARPSDTLCLLGLFQEVFDHSFDSALQSLISDFLSRIEQLFPAPDFKQVLSESFSTCTQANIS